MENNKQTQWSEVKKIKFHHRVKRFYHKDLFRKIYTVAIIGLIGANVFSLVKYYSVADELPLQPNTQTTDTQQSSGDVVNAEGENEDINLLSGGVDEGLSGDVDEILSGGIDEVLSGDINDALSGDVVEPSLEENTPLEDENAPIEETPVVEQSVDIEETNFVKESHGTSAIIQGPSISSISSLEKDTTQWVENEDFFPLNVKASDGKIVLFTIMDRNLGATESGTTCNSTNTGACGYYYQWGNNYGFANKGSITTDISQVDITAGNYGPGNYYNSGMFIKSGGRWDTDESNEIYAQYGNLNLWGGEKVYNSDADRQGPCPAGYHVPDILEWKAARETWCREKMGQADGQCNNGDNFRDDLFLPFAGRRGRSSSNVVDQGSVGGYWSSSPTPGNASGSYNLDFNLTNINSQSNSNRTNGFTVRCFKNTQSTQTLTFDADNGEDNVVYNIRWWEPITESHSFTPKKEGYKFMGWYEGDAEFNFSDTTFITKDTILRAKWKDPANWSIESGDFMDLDITGTDGKVLFTIMDRNLGAEIPGTGESSYGYYYQWGNNHGFSSEPGTYPANSGTDLVDITGEGYGPGKYYSSDKFIKRTTSPYRWDTDESNETYAQYGNLNLWGGENTSNPDSRRQGPCPAGYHVPDMFEWKAARESWCREKMGQVDGQCNNGSNFRDDLLLPFAGYRDRSDAGIGSQSGIGYYWSSSPISSNIHLSYYLSLRSSKIIPENNYYRAYGFSVRCFKDSQSIQILTFDADNGEDNVVYNIRWWEPITESHSFTPKKEGYKFVGWYEGDAEFNFSDTTFITENTVLNAKWEKYPWFTYDANGGVFADQSFQNIIKYSKTDQGDYITSGVVMQPTREGYTFDGWYVIENETEVDFDPQADNEIKDTTIYARWTVNKYTISFDTDGGNDIESIEVDYDSVIDANSLPVAVKDCNEFLGWDGLVETMPAHDITLKAKYNYTCSKSSGGGGRKISSSDSDKKVHGSADEENVIQNQTKGSEESTEKNETKMDSQLAVQASVKSQNNLDMGSYDSSYSTEQNQAYQFAKANGVTTQSNIKNADINGNLTRIQMAKMLSYYAINVMGKKPDTSNTVKFNDVSNKLNAQYDNGVTLSYQLGIMGQNMPNNRFRPNAYVTRAEFVTALSRLLYGIEDGKGNIKYYVPHMAKLYNEGIITNINSSMKEKRGYVMLMLMRSTQ